MRNIIIFFLLTCSIAPCYARLGETIDQSIARYGQPIPNSDIKYGSDCESMSFEKSGFKISADFYKSLCVGLHVKLLEYSQEGMTMPPVITDDEADQLLDQNKENGTWTIDTASTESSTDWNRSDGGFAQRGPNTVISIYSPNWKLYHAERQKLKEDADAATAAKAKKDLQGL